MEARNSSMSSRSSSSMDVVAVGGGCVAAVCVKLADVVGVMEGEGVVGGAEEEIDGEGAVWVGSI